MTSSTVSARNGRDRASIMASWVAYIFGLGASLVFRSVGLVSIAAGLLLSILYYAIPVERRRRSAIRVLDSRFWQRIKQQVKLERVSIPIPNFPKRKLVFVGTPLIAAIVGYSRMSSCFSSGERRDSR